MIKCWDAGGHFRLDALLVFKMDVTPSHHMHTDIKASLLYHHAELIEWHTAAFMEARHYKHTNRGNVF